MGKWKERKHKKIESKDKGEKGYATVAITDNCTAYTDYWILISFCSVGFRLRHH